LATFLSSHLRFPSLSLDRGWPEYKLNAV
jgi:hypothetical protein